LYDIPRVINPSLGNWYSGKDQAGETNTMDKEKYQDLQTVLNNHKNPDFISYLCMHRTITYGQIAVS